MAKDTIGVEERTWTMEQQRAEIEKTQELSHRLRIKLGRFLLALGTVGFVVGGMSLGFSGVVTLGTLGTIGAGLATGGIAFAIALALIGAAALIHHYRPKTTWPQIIVGGALLTAGSFAVGYTGFLLVGGLLIGGVASGVLTGGVGLGIAVLSVALVMATLYWIRHQEQRRAVLGAADAHGQPIPARTDAQVTAHPPYNTYTAGGPSRVSAPTDSADTSWSAAKMMAPAPTASI